MINILRGAYIVFLFVLFGIGAVIIRYFIMIFPLFFVKDKEKRLLICSKILQNSWKFFVKLLEIGKIIKINTKDIENIKNIKNSIITATHPCFVDVVVLMSIIPKTTCFAAEKLAKNPFFKGMVDLLFILERKDISKWEKSALEFLDKGYNVIIFPMGERHKKNEKPKIRKGASLLAQHSKKNIVLIKLETGYEFLMKNQPIYEIQREPVSYNISYSGIIDTEKMLQKYPDEVTFRHETTNLIAKKLYE